MSLPRPWPQVAASSSRSRSSSGGRCGSKARGAAQGLPSHPGPARSRNRHPESNDQSRRCCWSTTRRACRGSHKLRAPRPRRRRLHCRSFWSPQAAKQIESAAEQFLDRRFVRFGILIAEPGGHPLANVLEESGPREELLLGRSCSGPEDALPVEFINQFLSRLHDLRPPVSYVILSIILSPGCAPVNVIHPIR